ncbi:Putative phosphoribosyl transferase/MT0597 [Pigmentiphaga humi]|uniref:Phosphoribosyl transferase/MT0597 n=1 Tax=Pigmentiphaga humi TaxID=2478468 RepID=A0A3P4AYF2_9BURK|nr:phosphoribosyltransferase family protein [Pigmentiphaga humi]VCU68406.1 Putative phosphoribosyl transferase/MT0597 [Pigmentiphaga humi]
MRTRSSSAHDTRFADRKDAGRRLAQLAQRYRNDDPVVVALPRGGVPVGYEIAEALQAPLDILLVRKLGAPGQPEVGLGAIVDGAHPQRVLNQHVIDVFRPPPGYLEEEERRQLQLIEERRRLFLRGRPSVPLAGRTVIVVDDGIATGGTVEVSLNALAHVDARQVVLAVPVAAADALARMPLPRSNVLCLLEPEHFRAVSLYYDDFSPVTEAEVVDLLDRAAAARREK